MLWKFSTSNLLKDFELCQNPVVVVVNKFDDFQFIESDKYNLVGSGRRWFGDLFDFKLMSSSNYRTHCLMFSLLL